MRRTTLSLATLALTAAPTVCLAGDDDEAKNLTIGDAAPKIEIAHWVKGDTIAEFADDNVYVVEFWATWCGPCIASMPHISELQEKYADYDVTFIGVSDEPLEKVTSFLQKKHKDGKVHDDRTHYTLTTDPDRSVYKDYMTAASQKGIPTAFIVGKEGHVEWIGHPMQIDGPLDAVVHDSWDRDAYKVKWERENRQQKEIDKLADLMRKSMAQQDWETAVDAADDILEYDGMNSGVKMQKFQILLKQMKDADRAYAYGNEVVEASWDDSMMLNQIAWFVVDEPGIDRRDLDFAHKAAIRANELTNESNAAVLDTVARIYHDMGDLEAAIMWQKKAVASITDEPFGDDLREALDRYEDEAKK